MRRIVDFVSSHGKRAVGWDETLDDGLPQDGVVMTWRKTDVGVRAARARHDVIMTPSDFTYFDHPQADKKLEPISIQDPITLEMVYNYEPIPKQLSRTDSHYIIGAQGCLWTEFVKDPDAAEYMAFPRAIALSESLWSTPEVKNFDGFSRRLFQEFPKLDRENVNYRIPKPVGLRNRQIASGDDGIVDLVAPLSDGKIYYTLDGTQPTENSNLYQGPFVLDLRVGHAIELKTVVVNSTGRESSVFSAMYTRSANPIAIGP